MLLEQLFMILQINNILPVPKESLLFLDSLLLLVFALSNYETPPIIICYGDFSLMLFRSSIPPGAEEKSFFLYLASSFTRRSNSSLKVSIVF